MLKKIFLCLIIPFNLSAAASSSSGYAATSSADDARFRFFHGNTNFELTRDQCVSSRVLNEILQDVSSVDEQMPLACIQTLSGYSRARQQGADRLFAQAQSTNNEFSDINKQSYEQDLPMLSRMAPNELDTTPHGRLFNYIKIELNNNGLAEQDWKSGERATLAESDKAYSKMFALLQDPVLCENGAACDIARVKGLIGRHLQTYSAEEDSIIELADVATVCFDTLEVFNDAGVAVAVRAYNLGILQDLRPGVNVLTRAIAIRMINMYKKYYLALLQAGQRVERFPLSADISVADIRKADIKPLLFQGRMFENVLDMSNLKITSLRGIEKIPQLKEVTRLNLFHNFFVELQQYTPESFEQSDDIDFYLSDLPKHCFSERWFDAFEALTHLDLGNNRLKEVPLLPSSLTHLNLNNNCIENIERLLRSDEGVSALPHIEMLDMRNNYITARDVSLLVHAYRDRNNLNVHIFPQYSTSYIGKCFAQVVANAAVLSGLALLGYKKMV